MQVFVDDLKRIVAEQAEDDGLWFIARTAPEAYLQQALRRLHAAIEGDVAMEALTVPWVLGEAEDEASPEGHKG